MAISSLLPSTLNVCASVCTIEVGKCILRIFDGTTARAFYIDYLGIRVEFYHRFEADLPNYLGINRIVLQFTCPSTMGTPVLD